MPPFSINHAHLSVIFATAQHIPSLLKLVPKAPCLKLIVSIDDLSEEAKAIATTWAEAMGVQVKEMRESKGNQITVTFPSSPFTSQLNPLDGPALSSRSVSRMNKLLPSATPRSVCSHIFLYLEADHHRTQGTTGNPKGAVLTHGQLALSVQAQLCGTAIVEGSTMISYLPLAHIYAVCPAFTFHELYHLTK